jgi:uncharacterized protein (TIGR00251 family)
MKRAGPARNEARAAPPYRFAEGTVTLRLQVQPGAVRSEWAGRFGEQALRLRLAAPAADGKANEACVRFMAQCFSVPRSRVRIVRGRTGRSKTVEIRAVDADRWTRFRALWERA